MLLLLIRLLRLEALSGGFGRLRHGGRLRVLLVSGGLARSGGRLRILLVSAGLARSGGRLRVLLVSVGLARSGGRLRVLLVSTGLARSSGRLRVLLVSVGLARSPCLGRTGASRGCDGSLGRLGKRHRRMPCCKRCQARALGKLPHELERGVHARSASLRLLRRTRRRQLVGQPCHRLTLRGHKVNERLAVPELRLLEHIEEVLGRAELARLQRSRLARRPLARPPPRLPRAQSILDGERQGGEHATPNGVHPHA